MEVDLRKLLRLRDAPAVETPQAQFYVHVPSIAPYAYLHTIYAPTSTEVLSILGAMLKIPDAWASFLLIQNGADLFSNSLYFYGVNKPGKLVDRSSNYSQMAFSLQEINRQTVLAQFHDYLQIGSYGYNGARLLLSRKDLSLKVVSRSGASQLASWPTLEDYLGDECGRLASLFSDSGVLLTAEASTVPDATAIPQ